MSKLVLLRYCLVAGERMDKGLAVVIVLAIALGAVLAVYRFTTKSEEEGEEYEGKWSGETYNLEDVSKAWSSIVAKCTLIEEKSEGKIHYAIYYKGVKIGML